MANTLIRIRRSAGTAAPANGALINGELAYSHNSEKLFIGNTTGSAIEIGGRYWLNAIVGAYTTANNAAAGGIDAPAREIANAAFLHANSAYDSANGAFATANSANATAIAALPKAGGTITGDLIVSGNITVAGHTTYTNTQTMLIGDNNFVLNADLPSDAGPSEDAGLTINRGNQSNVTIQWLEASNGWFMNANNSTMHKIASNVDLEIVRAVAEAAFATGNGAFAQANSASLDAGSAFATANGAFAKANSASAQAANADFITTGTLVVARGGTGLGTVAENGIVYGQGTSAFGVAAAGTEGQVLQANDTGVPFFGHLDGGTF